MGSRSEAIMVGGNSIVSVSGIRWGMLFNAAVPLAFCIGCDVFGNWFCGSLIIWPNLRGRHSCGRSELSVVGVVRCGAGCRHRLP